MNWPWNKTKSEGVETKMTGTSQVLFQDSPFFVTLKNTKNATAGYSNKVVYSVVNTLVNKLLEVPILVSKDSNSKLANYFRTGKSLNPERLHMSKALGITELGDHQLIDIFESPNNYQTGIEFKRAFWFNKIMSEAGIIWVERTGGLSRKAGTIKAMHVIPTYMVNVVDSNDWKNPVLRYEFAAPTGQMIPLDPKDVIYSGNWNPQSMHKGYNVFDTIGNTVDKNNVNDLAQLAAFKNGGTGILFSSDTVTDGVGGVSDKMSPENMAVLKDTIAREYAGASNNKRMHFTNGFVTVTSFGDTLADLKMIEASEDDVKLICGVFGVSPILVGEGKSNTESNVVQAYKSLVTNNVVPKLREFDAAFNKLYKAINNDGAKIAHDITEFAELMPNMELVVKVYGNNPAVKLNELRVMLGLDTVADDIYNKSYIQSGFVPLEDAGFTNAYTGTQPQ